MEDDQQPTPIQFPRRREIDERERQIEEQVAAGKARQPVPPNVVVKLNGQIGVKVDYHPEIRSLTITHEALHIGVQVDLNTAFAHQLAALLIADAPVANGAPAL